MKPINQKQPSIMMDIAINTDFKFNPSIKVNFDLKQPNKQIKKQILGTPDYISPEVLNGVSNLKASDIWSFGIILYEMMVGIPPFNDETVELIFSNIKSMKIEWPKIGHEDNCLNPFAYDLMIKLLDPDPYSRIGIKEIKAHPFFKSNYLLSFRN